MPTVAKENPLRRLMTIPPPSDCTVLAILTLASLTAGLSWWVFGRATGGSLALHAALLAGFTAVTVYLGRRERSSAVQFLRPLATVAVMFTLYTSLGRLGLAAMPYRADAALSRLDTWLFGADPSLWAQRYQTPERVEFLSFCYAAFIPYINLSLLLNSIGRPPLERDEFLTGWVFTYAISYLGYLFLPAQGPVAFHADDYQVSLAGGFFHRLVLAGVTSSGGAQGAFPSLHVGASVYLCLYDLRANHLRGLTYLPLVVLIFLSTVFLRYHYVVDLIAGIVIAVVCIPLGRWAFDHWVRRRAAAALPTPPAE